MSRVSIGNLYSGRLCHHLIFPIKQIQRLFFSHKIEELFDGWIFIRVVSPNKFHYQLLNLLVNTLHTDNASTTYNDWWAMWLWKMLQLECNCNAKFVCAVFNSNPFCVNSMYSVRIDNELQQVLSSVSLVRCAVYE